MTEEIIKDFLLRADDRTIDEALLVEGTDCDGLADDDERADERDELDERGTADEEDDSDDEEEDVDFSGADEDDVAFSSDDDVDCRGGIVPPVWASRGTDHVSPTSIKATEKNSRCTVFHPTLR